MVAVCFDVKLTGRRCCRVVCFKLNEAIVHFVVVFRCSVAGVVYFVDKVAVFINNVNGVAIFVGCGLLHKTKFTDKVFISASAVDVGGCAVLYEVNFVTHNFFISVNLDVDLVFTTLYKLVAVCVNDFAHFNAVDDVTKG